MAIDALDTIESSEAAEHGTPKQRTAGSKRAVLLPAIAVGLAILRSRIKLLLQPLPVQDFMTYWAAGRLFLARANPYSSVAMYAIERRLGWHYVESLVLLNPPWALPLVALLGVPPYGVARHMWLVLSLIIEVASALALWRYFGGSRRTLWLALAVVLTFLPAGAAEYMGQITPLMLGGLTTFLLLLDRERWFLAGVALLALGVKPHLLYLVLFAILAWAIQNRRWSLLAGALLAYAGSAAAAIAYNHNVLGYFAGTTQAALDTSCGIGGVLRAIFGMQHKWLQFVPTLFGTAWFAAYWRSHRQGWSWPQRLPLLLLVSLVTAPYAWAHDYVLAMPAILALAVGLTRVRTDWLIPAAFYWVVQIVIFTVVDPLSKPWIATASTLWLVLYLVGAAYLPTATTAPESITGS